jgi:hypothetical protein
MPTQRDSAAETATTRGTQHSGKRLRRFCRETTVAQAKRPPENDFRKAALGERLTGNQNCPETVRKKPMGVSGL